MINLTGRNIGNGDKKKYARAERGCVMQELRDKKKEPEEFGGHREKKKRT